MTTGTETALLTLRLSIVCMYRAILSHVLALQPWVHIQPRRNLHQFVWFAGLNFLWFHRLFHGHTQVNLF